MAGYHCVFPSKAYCYYYYRTTENSSWLLTVSLGKNIPGRLSKVNVGGRYSHYLQRERGGSRLEVKARQKTQKYNRKDIPAVVTEPTVTQQRERHTVITL